ncbi:MAG: hypothetical protein JWN01_265 [Patescibacteria group bacterium]|nr:hypothetical protein [Patescibacteria group bacterium]
MYSPSSGNNAVYLQIDNSYCQITVGNAAMTAGQFTWVDYQSGTTTNKINVSLTGGSHTIELAGLDPGVGVDKVMLLTDTSCTPTGDGSNCVDAVSGTPTPVPVGGASPTPVPTSVVKPAPGATPGPNGATPVSGTISLPKASPNTTRTYYLDDKLVTSDKLDTTKLSDGTHTLKIVETDANGQTKVSTQKLAVKNNKGWLAQVLGWFGHPLNTAGVVVAVVLLASGGFALWRFKFRVRPSLPVSLGGSASPVSAVSPAATTIVYPDAPVPKP